MPKQGQIQQSEVSHYQKKRLRTYKDISFVSNKDSNNQSINRNPQTVDFQEYLYTEHFQSSQKRSASSSNHGNESSSEKQSQIQSSQKSSLDFMDNKKILIEMGENYTFADQMSSNRKKTKKQLPLQFFPQLNKKMINLCPLSHRNNNQKVPQYKFSSTSSMQIPSQSEFTSHESLSKDISLSDNQQDQAVTIYKEKQINEEMFLKISQQTKQILKLQQKLYYFEDLCKRLLKSEEQSSNVKSNLAHELKDLKKNQKLKTNTIKQLETKLTTKQKEIQKLKQSSGNIASQYRSNPRTSSLTKRQAERKNLLQQENFQNITLLESHNKIMGEKYNILIQKYEQLEAKSFDFQRQSQKYKKENQSLKKKILSVQNMNKILEKEISALNIKVFEMQNQVQKATYDKYASNLIRIKNFNCQGVRETNIRKNNLITEAFQATGPLSLTRT